MRRLFLYLMAMLYAAAGINHFISPGTYQRIMPPWVPWPGAVIAISGICEVIFGLLLLIPATRSAGAWLIIALLIAVFPANVQMAVNFYRQSNPYLWLAVARLPVQAALIWWAWMYTRN